MRLLLIGCTGLVGRGLVPQLQAAGHQLTVVSRRPSPAGLVSAQAAQLDWIQLDPATAASWEPSTPLHEALKLCDGVVNLAGEPIAEQRWTAQHRLLLESSRLDTTRYLVAAMATLDHPPSVLVNA
ncbi:MAG: NAD-dependent epimerase/dehydratase family protein, partial [Cyanobacteriota bacterium]|nr:NAD-dependent epimerase/dehydratase family protein [Cyanobacteriota bacterium]